MIIHCESWNLTKWILKWLNENAFDDTYYKTNMLSWFESSNHRKKGLILTPPFLSCPRCCWCWMAQSARLPTSGGDFVKLNSYLGLQTTHNATLIRGGKRKCDKFLAKFGYFWAKNPIFRGQGVKLLAPSYRESNETPFRVENIDRWVSNWTLGAKMCFLTPKFGYLGPKVSFFYSDRDFCQWSK